MARLINLHFYFRVLALLLIAAPSIHAEELSISKGNSKSYGATISSQNDLCIDESVATIRFAVELIKSNTLCQSYGIVNVNGDNTIASIDDIVRLVSRSPSIKSADFTYWAAKLNTKANYLKAFGPTINIQGSRTNAFAGSASQVLFSYENGQPKSTQQNSSTSQPSWTNALTPSITIPLFSPQQISLAKYYGSIEISTAYSSADSDLQQYNNALNTFVDLWIANQQLNIARENIRSAVKSLDVTVSQYRLGLLAVPDVAQSLTNLRNFQSNLASAILTYNSSLFSLASYLGVDFTTLSLSNSLFHTSTLKPIVLTSLPTQSDLNQAAVLNASEIYSLLYKAQAANDQSRYYLAQYIPSFGLNFIWSPSNEYLRYQAVTAGQIIDQYSQTEQNWGNSIILGFSWNLFDSFSAATSAAAQRKNAASIYQQASSLAFQKIASASTALNQIFSYNSQLSQVQQSIKSATISYDDTITAVKAGFSNITTLTQRLDQLTSAKSNYWSVYRQLLSATLNLAYLTRDGIFQKINPFNLDYSGTILRSAKLLPFR